MKLPKELYDAIDQEFYGVKVTIDHIYVESIKQALIDSYGKAKYNGSSHFTWRISPTIKVHYREHGGSWFITLSK